MPDHRALFNARCGRLQGGRGKPQADKGRENKYFVDVLYGRPLKA